MLAGRGLLLPLVLCHALCCLVTVAVNRVKARNSAATSFVRIHRSNPFHNLQFANNYSFFGDLMLEDEAEAEAGGDIQEKLVVRGQVVILECLERDMKQERNSLKIKDTHSDAAVRWFQDDAEVKPDLRVTWSVGGRLRISHAVSKDSGVWQCRKDGYFRRPLRLIVTIPPERPFLVYGGAQLAEGARLTTRAGNALTLHCVVEGGNPAPSIAWFLNEKEITANSSIRSEWRGPEDQFASVSNATIDRVLKSHHNASVVCRVVHPALSRPHTSHLRLNIEYPPDFRLRRWPVWGSPLREGSSVSLLCHVEANPPSLPFWIREVAGEEEEVGSTEGWLNFTNVQPDHRGWYKCSTNHPFGHFSSHSVYINVLHDESENPITQQYPLRQREQEQSGNTDYIYNNCPPPPYSEDGSDSSNNYIWRSDIKIKVMNRTHAALEGGPAMLTAHVCGGPVSADQVTWFPPSKETNLTPGKSFGRWTAFNLSSPDSQQCVLSNLHIVPVVGSSDAGSWIVLVIRSLSAHAAVVQLNVSTAAKSLAAATADINSAASHRKLNFLYMSALCWLPFFVSIVLHVCVSYLRTF